MTKTNLGIVFLGILGLAGACGSNGNRMATTKGCVAPVDPGCKVFPDDASFVRWAGPVTDGVGGGVSSAIVEHTPGRFCMSGTVDRGPNGTGWGALLLLGLTAVDETTGGIVTPLNAAALGINQLRFTLENPPLSGLRPQVIRLQSAACKELPACMVSFALPADVTSPGTLTLPFTDFTLSDADHANTVLDPTLIMGLQFSVTPLPGMALPYDFCLRDLAFLDAAGREITP